MTHVVSAGYGYADYIRQSFSISSTRPPKRLLSLQEALAQLEAMLEYTAQTLEGRWEMTDEEIESITMQTGWGVTYTIKVQTSSNSPKLFDIFGHVAGEGTRLTAACGRPKTAKVCRSASGSGGG